MKIYVLIINIIINPHGRDVLYYTVHTSSSTVVVDPFAGREQTRLARNFCQTRSTIVQQPSRALRNWRIPRTTAVPPPYNHTERDLPCSSMQRCVIDLRRRYHCDINTTSRSTAGSPRQRFADKKRLGFIL